jgi:hypothetical protein
MRINVVRLHYLVSKQQSKRYRNVLLYLPIQKQSRILIQILVTNSTINNVSRINN